MMVSTIIRSSWCHFRNGCLRLINFLLQHWWSYPLLLTTATTTTVNDKESGSLVLSSFLDEQIQRAKKQASKQTNNKTITWLLIPNNAYTNYASLFFGRTCCRSWCVSSHQVMLRQWVKKVRLAFIFIVNVVSGSVAIAVAVVCCIVPVVCCCSL